ncbi:MAG: hypothetical protein M9891_16155 [Austwickia sp.]|nr:hypothetical protein [Austwickia sp.]
MASKTRPQVRSHRRSLRAAAFLTAAAAAVGTAATAVALPQAPSRAETGAVTTVAATGRLSTTAGRAVPAPLRGVTIESVDRLEALVTALAAHTKPATVRIVFQAGTSPADYATAVRRLRPHAYLVGTVLDSTAVAEYSVAQVRDRTRQFVKAFGAQIDIWEVGNELNGEWLGEPADIRAKAQAAFDVVEREYAGLKLQSAVTLNYWPSSDCYAQPWEATDSFAAALPQAIRLGADHAWLSFYETACDPVARPSVTQFTGAFTRLAQTFPNARVGFGEVGVQGIDSGFAREPSLAERKAVANRYYGMHAALLGAVGSRYEGGYFWWTYHQDALRARTSRSMWPTLEALMARM